MSVVNIEELKNTKEEEEILLKEAVIKVKEALKDVEVHYTIMLQSKKHENDIRGKMMVSTNGVDAQAFTVFLKGMSTKCEEFKKVIVNMGNEIVKEEMRSTLGGKLPDVESLLKDIFSKNN